MTQEDKILEVVQGFKDGKKVEFTAIEDNYWIPFRDSKPSWNWNSYDYRLKEEPELDDTLLWYWEYESSDSKWYFLTMRRTEKEVVATFKGCKYRKLEALRSIEK